MIITLKLEGAFGSFDKESDVWYRLIEIDSNANLAELHQCIQDAVSFDNDHLYEFFIANSAVGSRKQKTFDNESHGIWDYPVGDLFPLPNHKKLFYLFDYGHSWYFRITKTRKKPKEKERGVRYPRVVEKVGRDPEQYADNGW